jgi:hypothetical protein
MSRRFEFSLPSVKSSLDGFLAIYPLIPVVLLSFEA